MRNLHCRLPRRMQLVVLSLFLSALMLLCLAFPAHAQEVKPAKLSTAVAVSLYATFAADAATSHYNLTHGGTEALIPSQNPRVVSAVIVAEAVALHYALRSVAKTNPRQAKILGWAVIASRAVIVGWNYSQIRKLR